MAFARLMSWCAPNGSVSATLFFASDNLFSSLLTGSLKVPLRFSQSARGKVRTSVRVPHDTAAFSGSGVLTERNWNTARPPHCGNEADAVAQFSTCSRRDATAPAVTGLRGWWNLKVLAKIKRGHFLQTFKTTDLRRAGTVMYSCCTDPLNHLHFFEVLGLPDTFNSWFRITELHVWMCLVRLSVESYDGKVVRKEIVKNMWEDVDKRSQRLGQAAMAMRKKQIRELAEQFRANLFAYDEGFLLDDKVLAAAIWRNFFGKECDDPRKVELLVHYVRKQMDSLENQDRYNLLALGVVKWVPVTEVV